LLPQSITELAKDWASGSQLREVIFESALSLRTMIENEKADLNGELEIKIATCDCELNFAGYSVHFVPGVYRYVSLVKTSSPTE
jgi:hypothetical protein